MPDPAAITVPPPEAEEFDPLELWIRHKSKIVLVAGILLLGAAGYGVYWKMQEDMRRSSQSAYASAVNLADFQKVATQYSGTISGKNAVLKVAELLQREGKLDEAVALLRKFVKENPAHPLIAGAYTSLGSALETQGKADEALAAYQKVATGFPASYAAPLAWMGQARVLKSQGKVEEARRAYETIIGQFQNTRFAGEAQNLVSELKK